MLKKLFPTHFLNICCWRLKSNQILIYFTWLNQNLRLSTIMFKTILMAFIWLWKGTNEKKYTWLKFHTTLLDRTKDQLVCIITHMWFQFPILFYRVFRKDFSMGTPVRLGNGERQCRKRLFTYLHRQDRREDFVLFERQNIWVKRDSSIHVFCCMAVFSESVTRGQFKDLIGARNARLSSCDRYICQNLNKQPAFLCYKLHVVNTKFVSHLHYLREQFYSRKPYPETFFSVNEKKIRSKSTSWYLKWYSYLLKHLINILKLNGKW